MPSDIDKHRSFTATIFVVSFSIIFLQNVFFQLIFLFCITFCIVLHSRNFVLKYVKVYTECLFTVMQICDKYDRIIKRMTVLKI